MRQVTCPVVIRPGAILAFRHPRAGLQIVKGGIEPGETRPAAAMRELMEEAGVATISATPIGASTGIQPGECWHFTRCQTASLPEKWTHDCADDGGHRFEFFWHPMGDPTPEAFDIRFRRAVEYIRQRVTF